jgi:hypothetical protein
VWYTAAHYKTPLQASVNLVSTKDLESNIDSVIMADNPKFIADLPSSISSKIVDPVKLAQYDAVEIAKTWPQLDMFKSVKMKTNYKLSPRRILKLLVKRELDFFNLERAIQNDNIDTLKDYIKRGFWTPCMGSVHMAIKYNANNSLLYLLEEVGKVPSAYWLDRLIKNEGYEALEYITTSKPDWRPSQDDVDEACAYGSDSALKWYFSLNSNICPSNFALRRAQALNYFGILEFCLERWYQYCLATLEPKCTLEQSQIDTIASRGDWRFLSWCSKCNPEMDPPNEKALLKARELNHFEVIKWAYLRFPNRYSYSIELMLDGF